MNDIPLSGLLANHLPEYVVIPAEGVLLPGTLTLPPYPAGVVLFAHEHLGRTTPVGSRVEAVR